MYISGHSLDYCHLLRRRTVPVVEVDIDFRDSEIELTPNRWSSRRRTRFFGKYYFSPLIFQGGELLIEMAV